MASGLGGDLEDQSLGSESVPILTRGFGSQREARERELFWTRTTTYHRFQEEIGGGAHQQPLFGRGIKAKTTEKSRERQTNTQIGSFAGVLHFCKFRKNCVMQNKIHPTQVLLWENKGAEVLCMQSRDHEVQSLFL